MSAFRHQDTLARHCDIDNDVLILVACAIMTGLAYITLVARIYARGWMTHSDAPIHNAAIIRLIHLAC